MALSSQGTSASPGAPDGGFRVEIFFTTLVISVLALALPLALLQVYDRILGSAGWGTGVALFVVVAVAIVLETICRFGRSMMLADKAAAYEFSAQASGLNRLFRADLATVEKAGPTRVLSNLQAPSSLRDFYSGQGFLAFYELPFAGIFLGLVLYLGGSLVLVPLAAFALVGLFAFLAGKGLPDLIARFERADERRNTFVTRFFGSLEAIRAMALEGQLLGRARRRNADRAEAQWALERRTILLTEASGFLGLATTVLIVGFGALKVLDGTLTVGGLTACSILGGRAIGPLTAALGMWTRVRSSEAARVRVEEMESLPESGIFQSDAAVEGGALELRQVTARWDEWLVEGLNLRAAPGTFVLFKGPRVATSLAFLTAGGFVKAAAGEVRVGDRPLADYSESAFRKAVGLVPYDSTLLDGTLLENLTLFDASREEAARMWADRLGLTAMVGRMPHGFLTRYRREISSPVGLGIVRRIAMARALAFEPKILLLDHAILGVDQPGERQLISVMEELHGKVTILFSSDRPAIVALADQTLTVPPVTSLPRP